MTTNVADDIFINDQENDITVIFNSEYLCLKLIIRKPNKMEINKKKGTFENNKNIKEGPNYKLIDDVNNVGEAVMIDDVGETRNNDKYEANGYYEENEEVSNDEASGNSPESEDEKEIVDATETYVGEAHKKGLKVLLDEMDGN